MKNQTKRIGVIAIITCIVAIGIFSLIGCATKTPLTSEYLLKTGNRSFELENYDTAAIIYEKLLKEFPDSPEAEAAKEKLAEAQRRKGGSESGSGSAVAIQAIQENPESDFQIDWDNNVKGGAVITKYTGTRRVVRIPATIQNTPVTSIGEEAFERTNITSVIIPNGVKTIMGKDAPVWNPIDFRGAFRNCTSLASVTIPDSITNIGNYAFYGCTSLTSITIPNGVTSIGGNTFYGCTSLTSITIPDSVTSIGGNTFYGCTSLTSVTIPKSVTYIGNSAFPDTITITVDAANATYSSHDRILYSKTAIIFVPSNITGAITIPNGITSIDALAFSDRTGITSVTIPDSVTSIGKDDGISGGVFQNCTRLASVTIGSGVTRIEARAFWGCDSLTSVTFQGKIAPDNLGSRPMNNILQSPFPREWDLRDKYLASDGGIGTYTRFAGGTTWRKQ